MSRLKNAWNALRGREVSNQGLTWADVFPNTVGGSAITPERAMRSTAVFSCCRQISGSVMTCPIEIYEQVGSDRKLVPDHPLLPILARADDQTITSQQFWETQTQHMLLHGQGYAAIRRKGPYSPEVRSLELLFPDRTSVRKENGRLIYRTTHDNGVAEAFDQDDILHLPASGWNGTQALSPISRHAKSIGLDLNALEFSSDMFDKGNLNGSYLTFDGVMTDEVAKALKEMLRERAGRGAQHEPLILGQGGEWKQAGMTARDAQLVDVMQCTAADIARIFGVPNFMIGLTEKSTSWGTGIEQQSIGYVNYTVNPHLTRFEAELKRKLFSRQPYFVEFNVQGLLRGDAGSRSEFYQRGLGGNQVPGWMTQNEVRQAEGRQPIEGGDDLYRPPMEQGNTDDP